MLKVLILEDEDVHFKTILLKVTYSKLNNFEIDRASTLKEALSMLFNKKYDLIISDMQLPDSQNFDTVEIIYKLYPKIPLIVMSANTDEDKIIEMKNLGVKEFFVKDLNYIDLIFDYLKNFSQIDYKLV